MKRGDAAVLPFALPLIALLTLPIVALAIRIPKLSLDETAWAAVGVSLRTSTASAMAIVLFGLPLSWLLSRRRFPFRGLLELLATLPAVLPPAAAGLALLLALGRRGLIPTTLPFTAGAVVIAQIYVATPFFVRPMASAFGGLDTELDEAARIDGANAWTSFWRIAMPLLRRPFIAALTLSWARALGEFGATALFAGNREGETQTLPLAVYLGFETDIDHAVSLSLVLMAVALGVTGVTALIQDRRQRA